MAIGFPACARGDRRYDQDLEILKEIVARALNGLGRVAFGNWSGNQFAAEVGVNIWSWGEEVKVEIDQDGIIWIESKCRLPTQCFDCGKNQGNVNAFFDEISRVLASEKEK